MAALRRFLSRRQYRRLRALVIAASRRYAIYVHRQWGKDTEGNPGWATDVDLAVSTVIRGVDVLLSLLGRFRDEIPVGAHTEYQVLYAIGEAVFRGLSLGCVRYAFVDAGMKDSNVAALLSGLSEDTYASEVRVERLSYVGYRDVPDFPCVRAVMRILNHRPGTRSGSSYEYFVDYDYDSCSVCGDYDVGSSWKRRGKRGGQRTLGEYT